MGKQGFGTEALKPQWRQYASSEMNDWEVWGEEPKNVRNRGRTVNGAGAVKKEITTEFRSVEEERRGDSCRKRVGGGGARRSTNHRREAAPAP